MSEEHILLCGRYELLHRIVTCAETIRWLACDRTNGSRVLADEFFADAIMRREPDGSAAVLDGCDVQYKSLSSDFEELCRYRMKLPQECPMIRPEEVFRENGTVYAIYAFGEMQFLDDYLARRGTMSWLEMKRAMGPVVGLISRMHADGVYHRGISPETILVDGEGKFWVTGLSIPAARTVGSEIASTLYFGYSAPEQYSSSSWQGTWTDVYSLAAVCYRMVTGTTPVEWRQRSETRPLAEPSAMAQGIPQYGSAAIQKGLCIDLSGRFRTPDGFWCGILSEADGGTIRYSVSEIPKRGDTAPEPFVRGKLRWIVVGIFLASVTIFGSMAISRHIASTYLAPQESSSQEPASETSSSEQESSSEEEEGALRMPDFTDGNIEKILLDPLYQQLFTFDIRWVYSETKSAGIVVEQYPFAGTPYQEGETILLSVSKGSERIAMPEVIGKTYTQAESLLTESEILFEVEYTAEGEESPGTVVSASVPAGVVISRTRDTVRLTVRAEEEQPAA